MHTTDRLCILTDINNTLLHAHTHTHMHTHTQQRNKHGMFVGGAAAPRVYRRVPLCDGDPRLFVYMF